MKRIRGYLSSIYYLSLYPSHSIYICIDGIYMEYIYVYMEYMYIFHIYMYIWNYIYGIYIIYGIYMEYTYVYIFHIYMGIYFSVIQRNRESIIWSNVNIGRLQWSCQTNQTPEWNKTMKIRMKFGPII